MNHPPANETWISNVLEMISQSYRPSQPRWRESSYGEDARFKYILSFLDLRNVRVLELGCLEGFWSVAIEKMGARENVAIEARLINVLKCQQVKELHNLTNTSFVQQDIEALYSGREMQKFKGGFDLVFALGLLYHLPHPAQALCWMRSQAPKLFLGTQYFDPKFRKLYRPKLFTPGVLADSHYEYDGLFYKEGGIANPVSGISDISFWPSEKSLLAMLRNAGYHRIDILGKDRMNGLPHLTLIAE